jgi:peroxiredoxin Q/BCP
MTIKAGTLAPDFELQDETGAWRKLSDYRGMPVILYFYPKDDTTGCTKEACGFRDDYRAYQHRNLTILGVSPDTPRSHAKFKNKYQLPFTLLADRDHKIADKYGAWGKKKFLGREYDGILRTTFLIDAEGRLINVFENVKPAEHSGEILGFLEKAGFTSGARHPEDVEGK